MAEHLHYDQEFDAFRVAMSYFLSAMAAHCAVAILDHERWRDHSIAYDVARHCRFPLFWAALAGTLAKCTVHAYACFMLLALYCARVRSTRLHKLLWCIFCCAYAAVRWISHLPPRAHCCSRSPAQSLLASLRRTRRALAASEPAAVALCCVSTLQ
jgi:hypothetical protein